MGGLRVVTDAAADVPDELAAQLGITVVSGRVRFGATPWVGTHAEFWRRVRTEGPAPVTSPPSVQDFSDVFVGEGPVLAVHVSGELSTTVDHARAAAVAAQAGGVAVTVVDSRSVSVGTGLVAVGAAEAAGEDVDADDVVQVAERLAGQVHVHAVIADVDFLVRGGRAGLIERPNRRRHCQVLAVQGHAITLGQHRDPGSARRHLLDHLEEHGGRGVDRWALAHAGAPELETLVARIAELFDSAPAFVVPLDPTVGTHTGPGAVVVAHVAR
jgi:DegV family protein with EDD domain